VREVEIRIGELLVPPEYHAADLKRAGHDFPSDASRRGELDARRLSRGPTTARLPARGKDTSAQSTVKERRIKQIRRFDSHFLPLLARLWAKSRT
jgi:hypothetical protein